MIYYCRHPSEHHAYSYVFVYTHTHIALLLHRMSLKCMPYFLSFHFPIVVWWHEFRHHHRRRCRFVVVIAIRWYVFTYFFYRHHRHFDLALKHHIQLESYFSYFDESKRYVFKVQISSQVHTHFQAMSYASMCTCVIKMKPLQWHQQ